MNTVRPRARKPATTLAVLTRAREIQGMLDMQGLEAEPEAERVGTPAPAGENETGPAEARPTAERVGEVKPLPYRQVLATWSDGWRERWGRRANELEESGLSWRDAEGRAFVETWSALRASGHAERN